MTSFFTKKIHLIDASTQTENVYGLQPIEWASAHRNKNRRNKDGAKLLNKKT